MLIHMSIHTPKPGKEQDLIASMHRFGAGRRLRDPSGPSQDSFV